MLYLAAALMAGVVLAEGAPVWSWLGLLSLGGAGLCGLYLLRGGARAEVAGLRLASLGCGLAALVGLGALRQRQALMPGYRLAMQPARRANGEEADRGYHHRVGFILKVATAEGRPQGGYRLEGELLSSRIDSGWVPAAGRVRVYVAKAPGLAPVGLRYGAWVYVPARLASLAPGAPVWQRPGTTKAEAALSGSIRTALWRQGLAAQAWCPAGQAAELRVVRQGAAWHPRALAQRVAGWVSAQVQIALPGRPREAAVWLALLTGDQTEIDAQIRQAYSAAGTAHMLAVSGGHVALVYGAIYGLLCLLPLSWQGRRRWRVRLAVLVGVWAFCLVAGLGGPVVRAAWVATAVQLALLAGRPVRPLQALGLSAVVLVLYRPGIVWELGFALSLAAVGGILLLYEPILAWMPAHWWRPAPPMDVQVQGMPSNAPERLAAKTWAWLARLPRRLGWLGWQAAALTTAAQVGVAPVLLVYFGQATPWFLVGNVAGVALSSLALYGGIGWMVLRALATTLASSLPPLAHLFGAGADVLAQACAELILALNQLMAWLAGWPAATVQGLYVSAGQALVLYAAVLVLLYARRLAPMPFWFGLAGLAGAWGVF